MRLGKDKQAESAFTNAAGTIESVAAKLTTENLIRSSLGSPPVVEIFGVLGKKRPIAKSSTPDCRNFAQGAQWRSKTPSC
jgi:hypothetical protein